jgi:hypothetical protein
MAVIGVTADGAARAAADGVVAPLLLRDARRTGLPPSCSSRCRAPTSTPGGRRSRWAARSRSGRCARHRERPPGALAAALADADQSVAGLLARRRASGPCAASTAGVGAARRSPRASRRRGPLGSSCSFPPRWDGGAALRRLAAARLPARDRARALLPVSRRVRVGASAHRRLLVGAYLLRRGGLNASRCPLLLAVPASRRRPAARRALAAGACRAHAFPANELRKDLRAWTGAGRPPPTTRRCSRARPGARDARRGPGRGRRAARPLARRPRRCRHSLARGWQRRADVERTTALYAPDPLAPAPAHARGLRALLDDYAWRSWPSPRTPRRLRVGQERDLVLRGLPLPHRRRRHGAWQVYRDHCTLRPTACAPGPRRPVDRHRRHGGRRWPYGSSAPGRRGPGRGALDAVRRGDAGWMRARRRRVDRRTPAGGRDLPALGAVSPARRGHAPARSCPGT